MQKNLQIESSESFYAMNQITCQTAKRHLQTKHKLIMNPTFTKKGLTSFIVFFLSLLVFSGNAQTVETFTTSGTWTCPLGVSSIYVEVWGAGGAGGGVTASSESAGGGGGGAYNAATITVFPGNPYPYVVGSGGIAGTGIGGDGGVSNFDYSLTPSANGGKGGGTGLNGIGGAGGIGGLFNGGNGAAGLTASYSGAGGGAAGSTANGGNASTSTAGITGGTPAGAGAAGRTNSGNGTIGNNYGAGGSGAKNNGANTRAGGNGAAGYIRITYTQVCTAPYSQPYSLVLTPNTTSITGSFTASTLTNGYLVIRTTTATAPSNPVNGTDYTVGTSALGGYIESVGAATTFTSTALASSTPYWYWVFGFNGVTCTGGTQYLTSGPLSNTATTLTPCVAPTVQPTSLILTPALNSIAGSFTASAASDGYLVIRTATSAAPSSPVNGTTYTAGTSALGGYIESVGTAVSFNSTSLISNTPYWYWVYAYNSVSCVGGIKYRTTSPLSNTNTTLALPCASPLAQPTALNLTAYSNSMAGTFTASASANGYLVIRTASSIAPTNPVNGTVYTVGTSALGGYIESIGAATTFNSNALTTTTPYWYWVYAYNAVTCIGGPLYLTSSPLKATATTLACGALTNTAAINTSTTTTLNWSALPWSLGHLPTSCETSEIILNRTTGSSKETISINLDVNISVLNFLLTNASTTPGVTILQTNGSSVVNIAGNITMTSPGANKFNRSVYANTNATTIQGNVILGRLPAGTTDGHAGIGSVGSTAGQQFYLYGDMTFNPRGYTTDEYAVFNFNKAGTQYIYNNTVATDTIQPVLFETLNIGTTNATTVILAGTNQDAYIENARAAGVTIGVNSTLDLPANYSLNKIPGGTAEPFKMLAGSKLRLGGDKSINVNAVITGVPGSNFPASFSPYTFNATSTVEYYGSNAITQTIYAGATYANLVALNGTGTGRAQKITTAAITVNTSFNINALTDVTLGALGSSTATVASVGPLNIASTAGLYCNANVVSGAGSFAMGTGSYLGIGHADGISVLGNATGNIQMTGGRTYTTTSNYIYNGLIAQITGNGLPATVNDLTTDNPTSVTIASNQLVNGVNLLKQGIFDIGTTKICLNGTGTLASVSGKMKANLAVVEMKGTTGVAQNLSGNWFVNKTISTLIDANTSGISVAATPADTLLIASALNYGTVTNSEIKTNDNLTLLSRDTATANFGEIVNGSGNKITGKVNIERYLFTKSAWRFLATPVIIGTSPNITTAWREGNSALTSNGYGTRITGPASYVGMDEYTQRGSLKWYNSASNAWVEMNNTAATLANNQGMMVFVRGDRGVSVGGAIGSTILRIKGDVRTGDQVFSVPAGKFESYGNPYPSRIDLRSVLKNNIANAFTVWNPNIPGLYNVGGYQTYVFVGGDYKLNGTGAIRNYLESGEAVFIQNNAASSGSITIHESDKGIGSSMVSRAGVTIPTLEINMFTKDASGTDYLADVAMLNFNNAYGAEVDNMDVRKISNTYDNIGIKNGSNNLVVERRPNLTVTDSIKFNTTGLRIADYRFELDPSVLQNTGLEAILKDRFLQTETAVSLTDLTRVNFSATTDAASRSADRFMIVFKQLPTANFTTISATRNADRTVTVNWGIQNENNVNNYSIEQSKDGIHFTAIATKAAIANNGTNPTYSQIDALASNAKSWYRIKANNALGSAKYSAIAMVNEIDSIVTITSPSISIFPNPVIGGKVNVHIKNQSAGNYFIQISNKLGQVLLTEKIQLQSNNMLHTINIGAATAGTYQLSITNEAGSKTSLPIMVK